MKVVVIRNAAGEVVGAHIMRGRSATGVEAGVVPSEGQTAGEIEVPDDLLELDAARFHRRLADLVRRKERSR